MTTLAKDRLYHGKIIRACVSAEQGAYSHRGRWIVQAHHETGNLLSDELCPHYQTLAQAKAAIDRDGAAD